MSDGETSESRAGNVFKLRRFSKHQLMTGKGPQVVSGPIVRADGQAVPAGEDWCSGRAGRERRDGTGRAAGFVLKKNQ